MCHIERHRCCHVFLKGKIAWVYLCYPHIMIIYLQKKQDFYGHLNKFTFQRIIILHSLKRSGGFCFQKLETFDPRVCG